MAAAAPAALQLAPSDMRKSITETLRVLCPSGTIDESVSRDVLVKAMLGLNPSWNTRDLANILNQVDRNGTGRIKIDTFVRWVFGDWEQNLRDRFPELKYGVTPSVPAIEEGFSVEYLTDVEGNWEYFLHFVHFSKILTWEGHDKGAWGPGILTMIDSGIFVFGGDAVDKGPGDIRFVRTLLSLKKRYWNRVFIIAGNRDINKLRFFSELAPGEHGGRFEERTGPYGSAAYWIRDRSKNVEYAQYIEDENDERAEDGRPLLEIGHLSTLHWMLDCNMGCQKTTFEARRHELALLQLPSSDEDVVDSFRDSVDPQSHDPWMLDLMRVSQLAAIVGDVLFVHAGLPDDCIGRIPGDSDVKDGEPAMKVRAWITALNSFKDQQINDYERQPLWREVEGKDGNGDKVWRRGGDVLIDYGVPGGFESLSVTYHTPFNNGNPHLLPPEVEKALVDAGIRRMFSGHQPHGESPTVVRHPATGLVCFTCDTSYSNMSALKLLNKANNRGEVVTMVTCDRERVHLKGILKDGSVHECSLHVKMSEDKMPDALVGRQLTDGSWVKTLSAGNAISTLGKGFQIFVNSMHPVRAQLLLKAEFNQAEFKVQIHEMTKSCLRHTVFAEQVCLLPEPSAVCFREISDRSKRQSIANSHQGNALAFFQAKDFMAAEIYILDDRGTLKSLKEKGSKLDRSQLKESVIQKVNELLARKKRVIFSTNDSNFSREAFLTKLLRRGLNVCEKPEDALYLLRVEVARIDRHIAALKESDGAVKSCEERQKQQAEARIKHYMDQCKGAPPAAQDKLSSEGALRNVITTAFSCAWYLYTAKIKRPFVVTSDRGLLQELQALGITDYIAVIDKNTGDMLEAYNKRVTLHNVADILLGLGEIDAVVIGWDLRMTAMKVTVAAALLQLSRRHGGKTIPLITCSSDKGGVLGVTQADFFRDRQWSNFQLRHFGNGTMTSAVCACAGIPEDDVIDVGRPGDIFLQLLQLPEKDKGLAVDFTKAVMIGDTLATDIEMASRSGMQSLLVLTGSTSELDVQREENPARFPTWILESLARIDFEE